MHQAGIKLKWYQHKQTKKSDSKKSRDIKEIYYKIRALFILSLRSSFLIIKILSLNYQFFSNDLSSANMGSKRPSHTPPLQNNWSANYKEM